MENQSSGEQAGEPGGFLSHFESLEFLVNCRVRPEGPVHLRLSDRALGRDGGLRDRPGGAGSTEVHGGGRAEGTLLLESTWLVHSLLSGAWLWGF